MSLVTFTLTMPHGFVEYLDELRGEQSREAFLVWMISAEMARRDVTDGQRGREEGDEMSTQVAPITDEELARLEEGMRYGPASELSYLEVQDVRRIIARIRSEQARRATLSLALGTIAVGAGEPVSKSSPDAPPGFRRKGAPKRGASR